MVIASQKRKENIAEYLLYMWQIEDLIRANDLDIEKIKANIIDRHDLTPEQYKAMVEWYESLIDMMRREGVTQKGHLQMNANTLGDLVRLHRAILAHPGFDEYKMQFNRTLPYIVELRSKAGDTPAGELETCFNALYGVLMLRMAGKEVNADTLKAVKEISGLLAMLARDYRLDEEDRLFDNKD